MAPLKKARFDPALVVRDGLRENAPHLSVELGASATYAGNEPVTVVQASYAPAPGTLPGNRWLFAVNVTLMTFAPTIDEALTVGGDVADVLLSLAKVGSVRLSSVTCTSEPTDRGHSAPSGASTVASTYTAYMRREE